MKRRFFLNAGALLAAAGGARVALSKPGQISLHPKLGAAGWTLVGSREWSQGADDSLLSPVWKERLANKPDLLKREDIAYAPAASLEDTDVSVEFQLRYWSITEAGLVFRSPDSARFYYVQLYDMERKGPKYHVRLFVQDSSGYRRDIAAGFAPHPELPERIVQMGPRPEEWESATPGWVKLRVQAAGPRTRVAVDDKLVLEAQDSTYPAGRVGILARGPVVFRNLSLAGSLAASAPSWTLIPQERPSYFYPYPDPEKRFGDNQTYPGICRTAEGHLLVWMSVRGDPHRFNDFLLVRSRDDGKTWGDPVLVTKLADGGTPGFFFGHRDGRISCLFSYNWQAKTKGPKRAFSSDGGKTWTEAVPLVVSGKPLYEIPQEGSIGPYSPVMRYSDGTLLQFCYHVQAVKGGSIESNAERRDRSLVIRSTDDGQTWTGPHYLDVANFDSNEAMGVERSDGSIIAFSRTLRAPFMWTSVSKDKGLTWSTQVPSDCTGECPFLLRHSSGVLIMGSRGAGVFMKTSTNEGRSWSRETRVSMCSGMMGMTETKDGRVLVVFHEAYRTPTRIRGQFLRVSREGTLEPA